METTRQPRIVIEDLPAEQPLTEEVMARILGAGRFRPNLEALEDRLVMSANAISIVGGVTASFSNLNDGIQFPGFTAPLATQNEGILYETIGGKTTSITGVQGVFQGKDSSGDQVAYDWLNYRLNEFTPNHGWVAISAADQVVQDDSGDVFFRKGSAVFEATGIPGAGVAGAKVVQLSGVQALVEFGTGGNAGAAPGGGQVLSLGAGGNAYRISPNGQATLAGGGQLGVAQVPNDEVLFLDQGQGDELVIAVPATGENIVMGVGEGQSLVQAGQYQALFLQQNGTLSVVTAYNVNSPGTVTTGVQALVQTTDLTPYVLKGGFVYQYSAGNLNQVSGPTGVTQLAVDSQGQVYALDAKGVLEAVTGLTVHQITTGVTAMAVDPTGKLLVLKGTTAYEYYNGALHSQISGGVQMALDSQGHLYTLDSTGVLSLVNGITTQQVDTGISAVGTAEGNVWALTTNNQVLRLNGGSFSQWPSVVAPDGSIWFLGSSHLYNADGFNIYNFTKGKLTPVVGNAITLGTADGAVYALDGSFAEVNKISRWNGSSWTQVPSAVASNNIILFLGTTKIDSAGDRATYSFSNSGLTQVQGEAVSLVEDDYNVLAVNASNQIFRWNGKALEHLTSVVAADGSIWYLGTTIVDIAGNYAISRLIGGTVTPMPGDAVSLVAALGTILKVNIYNQVASWNGSSWTQHASAVADDGTILFLGTASVDTAGDVAIYKLSNGRVNTVCVTSTAIGGEWISLGGPKSALGMPTGNVSAAADGSNNPRDLIQNFANGSIYAPAHGTVQVWMTSPSASFGLTGNTPFTISPDDIVQLMSSTCAFLSSLAAVAQANPSLLYSHIKQDDTDPHGAWDVQLYIGGQWQTYHIVIGTITPDDPSTGPIPGQSSYTTPAAAAASTQNMWVVAFQRAYLMAEKVPANMVEYVGSNYLPWRDSAVAMQTLTGNPVGSFTLPSTQFDLQTLQYLVQDPALQDAVTVSCPAASANRQVDAIESLVGSHEYSVVGVYSPNQPGEQAIVMLRNPWGYNPDGNQNPGTLRIQDGGYLYVTWSQFVQDFNWVYASHT